MAPHVGPHIVLAPELGTAHCAGVDFVYIVGLSGKYYAQHQVHGFFCTVLTIYVHVFVCITQC